MSLSEFRPAACRLSSFQLLHVAVSELCRLSEFTRTGPHHFPGGSPLIVAELYLICANVVTLLLITS